MTIRHLKIFIAVAEAGTMSQAAKNLYIAQPTVSQVISEMEETYQIRLFERLSKKLYITSAGEQLLQYARHAVSLFEEMERSLRNAADSVVLRAGATLTVGSCVLAGIIRRFEEEHPAIRAQVVVDNTHVIEKMLLNSSLDLAFVEGQITSPELQVTPVIRDELVLICGAGHPYAARDSVCAADLEGQDFILREKGSGTRALFEDSMRSRGISIMPKWTCYSSDAILSAVGENQGLGVISRMLVEQKARDGVFRILPIRDAEFHRFFSLVYHRDKFLSEPLRFLIRAILESSREE